MIFNVEAVRAHCFRTLLSLWMASSQVLTKTLAIMATEHVLLEELQRALPHAKGIRVEVREREPGKFAFYIGPPEVCGFAVTNGLPCYLLV